MAMKISRRDTLSFSGALIASVILASCSNDDEDKKEGEIDRSKLNPSEVSRFINNFYHESFESSLNNFKNGRDLDKALIETVGAEKYFELTQASDPYFALSELPQEEKDKISEEIENFNTTSHLYKTDDLNSDQKLYLNISVISLNNTLPSAWSNAKWSITAKPEAISFDGAEAEIGYKDLEYVYDGRNQEVTVLPGGAETLHLILDGSEWKINGAKHIDQLLKLGVGMSGDGDR